MKVWGKVESRGRTTYNGLQMNLWRNFQILIPDHSNTTPDQQQYDEKNIRRTVYDELNVLMAMDIISKDKKEIQWKGLPRTSLNDVEELKISEHIMDCKMRGSDSEIVLKRKQRIWQSWRNRMLVFKTSYNAMKNNIVWEVLLAVVWLYLS